MRCLAAEAPWRRCEQAKIVTEFACSSICAKGHGGPQDNDVELLLALIDCADLLNTGTGAPDVEPCSDPGADRTPVHDCVVQPRGHEEDRSSLQHVDQAASRSFKLLIDEAGRRVEVSKGPAHQGPYITCHPGTADRADIHFRSSGHEDAESRTAWCDAFVEKAAASALRVAHHHGPAPRLRLPIGQTGGSREVQVFMKGRPMQSAPQHQMAFVVLAICQIQQQHLETGGWQVVDLAMGRAGEGVEVP